MKTFIYKGHIILKRFGQHFLHDQSIINNIVKAINPQKGQTMVEIGPGLFALTEPISRYLDHLTVIELDRNLVRRLQTNHSISHKLTIYQNDAITVDFSKLSEEIGKPLRIFGNLPYNISIPLIFHLFKYNNIIADMHFMLQKEIVDRLIAEPNTKAYGRLSIMAKCFCDQIIPILEVPPNVFTPSPKVESTLVRLIPYTRLPYSKKDIHNLNCIISEAFSKRRKMIRNSLSNFFTTDVLNNIGIDPTLRAENVSFMQYCQLANIFNNDTS